ncbi:MAG: glycosyltransferase [Nitrospira sp.]|nr:glycosyltransferase [Nitrospira sp.]
MPDPTNQATNRPLVSIVTPSFNQAGFIEGTIRSVLEQDYPNVEYLVLDGGSSDGSAQVIKRYEHRLAYWTSEPDKGQADAINRGWRMARGEILAYLNADDQYLPGAMARAVELFSRHPDVGIVYGSCYSVLPTGTRYEYVPAEYSLERLLLENFIPQPAVFIRRSVLDQVGLLDDSLHYCLDYDLWLRAALAGIRFHRIEGPALASFRIWPGSKTSDDPERWINERFRVMEQAFAHEKAPRSLEPLKVLARAKAYLSLAYGVSICGDLRSVRVLLKRAFQVMPSIIRDPQFLSLAGAAILGRRGSHLVRQAKWAILNWHGYGTR